MPESSGERIEADTHYWGSRHRYAYREAAYRVGAARYLLEVGCGNAYGLDVFVQSELVVALDADVRPLLRAGQRSCRYIAGEAARLPFADGSFDAVVSFQMIEHVSAEGGAAMIRECHRVLRPGGRLVLTTPSKRAYGMGFDLPNEFHLHEYEAEELRELVSAYFEKTTLLSIVMKAGSDLRNTEGRLRAIQAMDRIGVRRIVPEPVKNVVRRLLGMKALSEMRVDVDDFALSEADDPAGVDLFVEALR